MLDRIHPPTQTALREKHRELLADIEAIAERANASRSLRGDAKRRLSIIEAAEAALVRVHEEWRKSRGGTQNTLFFEPLSARLRRIIRYYRPGKAELPKPATGWVYRIVDYEQIPFHRLRPYFRASAVDEAIRMGISLGLRDLPGVRIYEESSDE
jgi:hypothetical protein